MARDDVEQQAMTAERLRVSMNMVRLLATPGVMAPEAAEAILTVLAEVERQRAALDAAEARAAALVAEHEQAMELVQMVAETEPMTRSWDDGVCLYCGQDLMHKPHDTDCLWLQVRALLAATDEADKQPPCPVCGTPGRHVTSGWWCDGCNLPFRRPGEAAGQE